MLSGKAENCQEEGCKVIRHRALHCCCDMERTGRLLPIFLWAGVPLTEWDNQLKLLTRKTEWSLEGKAHPSKQFPPTTGTVGFGEQSCLVVPDICLAAFCI